MKLIINSLFVIFILYLKCYSQSLQNINNYVLSVGITKYKFPEFNSLKYADKEALMFSKKFVKQ